MIKVLFSVFFFLYSCLTWAETSPEVALDISNPSELAPKATILQSELNNLNLKIGEYKHLLDSSSLSKWKSSFIELTDKFEQFRYLNYLSSDYRIIEVNSQGKAILSALDLEIEKYTKSNTELAEIKKYWQDQELVWRGWRKKFSRNYDIVKGIFSNVNLYISQAFNEIQQIERPLLQGQSDLVKLQSEIKLFCEQVEALITDSKNDIFEKNGSTFFSSEVWLNINYALFSDTISAFKIFDIKGTQLNFIHYLVIILQIFSTCAVYKLLRRLKNKSLINESFKKFVSIPFSSATFICFALFAPYYFFAVSELFKIFLLICVYFSGTRLVAVFLQLKKNKFYIFLLVSFFIFAQILTVVNAPDLFVRCYIALVSLSIVTFFACYIRKLLYVKDSILKLVCLYLALIMGSVSFVAQMLGYSQLSLKVFNATICSAFSCFFAWIFTTIVTEAIVLISKRPIFTKLPVIKYHIKNFVFFFQFIVDFVVYSLMFARILVYWGVCNSIGESINYLLTIGCKIDGHAITVGNLLVAIGLLLFCLFTSWGVRRFLSEEFYPKNNVQVGVGISINRILQYTFICIGLVVFLSFLGFDLHRLFLAFGVLGVGIGFGLQNIVNNFASGVILLFERPIKVGDVIDVDGQRGVIKKLGLRAAIVETYEKAEVIVPNSNITSSQVKNWTLSNRKTRTILNFSVAYDSDVNVVMSLLTEIAKNQPLVANFPEPVVYFKNMGAYSLDFELRIWSDVDDAAKITSEINKTVWSIFQEQGINVPYPLQEVKLI